MIRDIFLKDKKKKTKGITIKNRRNDSPAEKCKKCNKILMKTDIENNLFICPKCDYHFTMPSDRRVESLIDEGSFVELDEYLQSKDPLEFPTYLKKIEQDKEKTNMNEAIITGEATINGIPFVIGVMDSRFRMGSMGSVVGEKITRAVERAVELNVPFVLFSASGGARMQEGIYSLMQMGKTSAALSKLNEKGLLFVSVMTNPTTGGVSASFASLGDINLAEPEALIGFAGRRVIEQTVREKLPDDFQSSEFLLKHGQLDKIVHRKEMRDTIYRILIMHGYKGDNKHE